VFWMRYQALSSFASRSASSVFFSNPMHTACPCGSSQHLEAPGDKLGGKV